MAADKTIEQLLAATALTLTDDGVVVQSGITKKTELSLLVALLSTSISLGSLITFGTTIPTGGKDTDVYIKTDTYQFYQKISGSWAVFFTMPSPGSGTTVIYASGAPLVGTGNNGDTYINTDNGVFYLKTAGTWAQVFSMATGPQGPPGTAGTNGTNGVDGKTIRNGNGNPSNGLGVNGDFYINTTNYTIFGPKASGIWGSGTSLIYIPDAPIQILGMTANTIVPILSGYFIKFIYINKVSGSPSLNIGTSSGGGQLLDTTPISGFFPLQAQQYYASSGNLYLNISGGGSINITIEYISNIV